MSFKMFRSISWQPIAVLAIILLGCSACRSTRIGGAQQVTKNGRQLIFQDEFNGSGQFDTSKWSFAAPGKPAWMLYLKPDTQFARVSEGRLRLKMDKTPAGYQSVGIETTGKFSFQYGRLEVRARFNRGKGSWPAIWMMPEFPVAFGDWPASGEIDVMEHVNNEDQVHQTIHNAAVTDLNSGSSTATSQMPYRTEDFNDYAIEWTPEAIIFFVNGISRYSYKKAAGADSRQWPFDQPFYIILNQSGGAGWPGAITDADLPFWMEVDYVRVYQ
ncbi:glycoside hydrolase family 16 protein [Niabella terrae]